MKHLVAQASIFLNQKPKVRSPVIIKPEESAKDFAKEAFDYLLKSKPHKRIIDAASSKFGTGITFVPIAPESIVNYSETSNGVKKEGVRIEKADDFDKRFYTVIIICNF